MYYDAQDNEVEDLEMEKIQEHHPDDIGFYTYEPFIHNGFQISYIILDPANNEMDPADVVRLLNERKTSYKHGFPSTELSEEEFQAFLKGDRSV